MSNITDFIPAEVLEREGYIHISDTKKLQNLGFCATEVLKSVTVTVRDATRILREKAKHRVDSGEVEKDLAETITPATLGYYVRVGYLTCEADGKISLFNVLNFDYADAKKKARHRQAPDII